MTRIKPDCTTRGAEHPGDLVIFLLCPASNKGHYCFFKTVGLKREREGKDQP